MGEDVKLSGDACLVAYPNVQLAETLEEILEASIAITGANYGNIQMLNADGTGLEIAAQQGFSQEFLDHFKFVPLNHGSSVCAQAAEKRNRIMVRDVEAEPAFAEHLAIARGVPFRAVQSTPLFGRDKKLLGMLSTHFRKPKLPNKKKLHMLDLYALQAARVIELMLANFLQDDPPPVTATVMRYTPMSVVDKKLPAKIIRALPFFSDLHDKEIAELLKVSCFRHLQRKEILYMPGDPLQYIYWVCVGMVQKYRTTTDGYELTSAIRVPGDLLYDPDALQRKRVHTMFARALENTTLLAIPMRWFEAHLKMWDHLANKFLQVLSERAQTLRVETEHHATFNTVQNIICFLQHLCVLHHLNPQDFMLPYTKSLIASRLGIELESLSRALPKLPKFGVHVKGKRFSFNHLAAAQDHSCNRCSVLDECKIHKSIQKLVEVNPPPKKAELKGYA